MKLCVNDYTHTVRTYYNELSKYKVLTLEEEKKLVHDAKLCNIQARNALIEAHLKYVFSIAKRYKGYGVPIEELIAEGNLGLFKAIEMFDENRGVKFASCAVWWIKAAIKKLILNKYNEDLFEVQDDVLTMHNKEHNCEQMCETDYMCEDDYKNNDSIIVDDNETSNNKILKYKIVHELLDKLPERNKFIMQACFGIDMSKLTLDEIGNILHISKERVRKIRNQNMRILRSNILMIKEINDIY